jgi:hypothetical protein
LPEPPLLVVLEALLELLLVPAAAAFELVLVLELDDDPHAASRSATAARPATVATHPGDRYRAVVLMCGSPSSAASGARPFTSELLQRVQAWRNVAINRSVARS